MEVPGKRTDTDGELASLDELCQPCEIDNANTQASGFCKECEQYMCNTCFRQHRRAKPCTHHTLLDIDVFSEKCARSNANGIKCKQHDGETVKYNCRAHEAVGCGDCLVSKHNGCKPEFITDLCDNFEQNAEDQTLINKVKKVISDKKGFEKKIQEKKDDNKLMIEKALGDIKQFRLDINKYLDKVERDITCQVKNVMEENDTLLTKLENDCTMLSAKLEEMTDMWNSELYEDNVLFIHEVEWILPEYEKAISDMKSKSMKKYEFVCDQQFRSIVTSSQKLGTLAISTLAIFPQTTDRANENSESQTYARENERRHKWEETGRECLEGGYKKETIERENVQTTRKTEYGDGDFLLHTISSELEENWILRENSLVAVGARVKHNRLNRYFGAGTVITVHKDGEVTVTWDRYGWSKLHRIGEGGDDVTLI